MPVMLPLDTLSHDRQFAHPQALCVMVERRQHVEARQRGVEGGAQILSRKAASIWRCSFSTRNQTLSRCLLAVPVGERVSSDAACFMAGLRRSPPSRH
jgi:hypothetical protein